MRLLIGLVFGFTLAGCAENGLTLPGFGAGISGQGVKSLAILDRSVSVRGPEGYCVDRRASRARDGFVILAGCALISSAEIMPALDGLILVQVGDIASASVTGSEAEMVALLESASGRQILSDRGDGSTVEIDHVEHRQGVVSVIFADSAAAEFDGVEPQVWRAFLDIRGRLTTVSVRSFSRAPLTGNQGRALLNRAVAALILANPDVVPAGAISTET